MFLSFTLFTQNYIFRLPLIAICGHLENKMDQNMKKTQLLQICICLNSGGPKLSKLEEMAIFRTDFCTGGKLVFLKFFFPGRVLDRPLT